MYFVTQGEVSS